MFVELVTLGLGVPVMLGCVFGLVLANRGRPGESAPPAPVHDRPRLAAVTPGLLGELPLVAPDRAGYGTASQLLLQAALEHRDVPSAPDSVPGRRTGTSQAA